MNIFNLFTKKEESWTQNLSAETAETAETGKTSVNQPAEESVKPGDSDHNVAADAKRVHNLIILDESGSMTSIYRPALTGVNETLQTIRGAQDEHPEQTHFVTLVAFDTRHYNQIYAHVPAANAVDITEEQYRPGGGTPLYDAMGRGLTELRREVAEGDVVLVTIITDGYENASREYNGKAIKALVETLKGLGWVFTYIGANQDVEAVAASMSIDNHLAFEADEENTKAMFEKESRSRRKFFSKISENMPSSSFSIGYFDE